MNYYWIGLIVTGAIFLVILITVIIFTKTTLYYKLEPKKSKPLSVRSALKLYKNQNKFCVLEPSTDKIIAFKWDGAGFNNARMAVEIIFGLSITYDRTIILPPPGKWAHIPGKTEISDFYDIEALKTTFSILESKEYFKRNVTYEEYCKYFTTNNNLSNISENNMKTAQPLESNLSFLDSILKTYLDDPVWFLNMRMFGNVDKYFDNTEYLNSIREKIFQGFKFKPGIIRKVGRHLRLKGIIKVGSYNAIHYRAGDFKQFRKEYFTTDKNLYVDKIKSIIGKNADKIPLLVVTNETNSSELEWLTDNFNTIIIDLSKESHKNQPIIDMLMCTTANKFIGTSQSTFSYYIQILRGYMSSMIKKNIVDDEPYFLQIDAEKKNVKRHNMKWSGNSKGKGSGGGWELLDMSRWKSINIPNLNEYDY